jgi:multidrug efflux pump subunit AcrA (membrane-fusion protein)
MGGTQHRWEGHLNRLDAAIDPATRTIYGTVSVDDPYGTANRASVMPLAVGLYVDAEIEGRPFVDTVQIVAEGLRAGNEVYVLSEEGLLEVRQIDVIHRNRDIIMVGAGVEAGDQVVISAIRNPVSGMRLEAIETSGVSEATTDRQLDDDNEV